ncbi:MAG: threonine synthase [Kiritimatiellae bacterium]|nr:threonine synthase [Kiritimatiellia bacterium]
MNDRGQTMAAAPAGGPIRYVSTHRELPNGEREPVGLATALERGLAPDGGLYLPERVPALDLEGLVRLRDAPYWRVAEEVLRPFVEGVVPPAQFSAICEEAYDFDVPLEPMEEGLWLLRLDRGPTASFKDFAARWMARMLRAVSRCGRATVLVATSGDTGSAVGEAFREVPGFRVFVLYPRDEVSEVQRRQLDRIGANVTALAVEGTFDDCQAMVKEAFLDRALAPLRLTSANSINVGRILPQAVYYVYAWLRVSPEGTAVTFSVPSGNLGNSFGCELARRMGLPVARLILAVNENDEVPRFLATGAYRPISPSRACLSNAMNVGHPSNLARYVDWYGGVLTRSGELVRSPEVRVMRRYVESISISDAETVDCLRRWWRERRVLLEPHGAVGVAALERLGGGPRPAVCLETAHPAKFPEVIERELGFSPAPPASFERLASRPLAVENLPADYTALRARLLQEIA